MWTVARVKAELPDVPVRGLQGVDWCGITGGRRTVATVWIPIIWPDTRPGDPPRWSVVEWDWQIIADCLNDGIALRFW